MTSKAREILGAAPDASPQEIDQLRRKKRRALEEQILLAANPGLKQKYQDELTQLEAAYQQIPGQEKFHLPGLSVTRMRDREGAKAYYRENEASLQVGISCGDLLAGRFLIKHLLGAGPLGAVFLADDTQNAIQVAIKIFLPGLFSDSLQRNNFVKSLGVCREVLHFAIVRNYSHGLDGEFPFITMDLCKGITLRDEILRRKAEKKQFSLGEITRGFTAIAKGLKQIPNGFAHSNIKPENIFVMADGAWLLSDCLQMNDFNAAQISRISAISGSTFYRAPEQLNSERGYDSRIDQYALGVILYEVLTLETPSARLKPVETARKRLRPELIQLVDRLLESDPAARYLRQEDFYAALEIAFPENPTSSSRSIISNLRGDTRVLLAVAAIFLMLVVLLFRGCGSSAPTTPIVALTPLATPTPKVSPSATPTPKPTPKPALGDEDY